MGTTAGPVQSIDRVIDIIETLSCTPQGMNLSTLSDAVNLHISTTHRLLVALAEHGYVIKDSVSGKYRLTLRLFEIGSRVSGILDLLTIAKPLLDELAAETQEAVHLVERDGNDVVYLYKAEPFHSVARMGSFVGLRNPMYCTGVGKCILANLPIQESKKIWDNTAIVPYTHNTITEFDLLLQELAQIRKQGYAIDNEEHEPGIRCIAVPIRNCEGSPIAAISIAAPVARMDEQTIQKIYPRILSITKRISSVLGHI